MRQAFTTHTTTLHHISYDPDGAGPRGVETLSTTAAHPFHVPGRGFVTAEELRPGDALSLANGTAALVHATRLERPQAGGVFQTYNLTIETDATYFVGADGVLVHNATDTRRLCERAYSSFVGALRGFPGDPVAAFEQAISRFPAFPGQPHAALVEEALKTIERMKVDGTLDARLRDLGTEGSIFRPEEGFAARRFELKKGQEVTRASSTDADFVDELGDSWDIKGPLPDLFDQEWNNGNLPNSLRRHYDSPDPTEKLLFDAAGLDDVQKAKVRDLLLKVDPQMSRFEIME